MKPLLSKITKPFLVYVLIVLLISIPVYYFVVDAIWLSELDEHNRIIAEKTSFGLNSLQLSEDELSKSIALWKQIQPGTNIEKLTINNSFKDSIYTIGKQKAYVAESSIDRFRCLKKIIHVNGKPYSLTVETNVEETHETIVAIAAATTFFFIIILAGLLFLTRKLTYSLWQPFKNILNKLQAFNLNDHASIEFETTNTAEFEELKQVLTKLIAHNISVYKTQKEFTENASHELQTPLAILKNKLDILLQNKDLTEEQYQIAEEMNRALTRSARINKNLLLLAKIDNNQFNNSESIQLDRLLWQSIETLQEHFEQKNLSLQVNIAADVYVRGSTSLTEILIDNLLINAIRHTLPKGSVLITLTKSSFEVINSGEKELNADLLFKRFSSLSYGPGGSGLGLAINKEICQFHKWVIKYRFDKSHHVFFVHF